MYRYTTSVCAYVEARGQGWVFRHRKCGLSLRINLEVQAAWAHVFEHLTLVGNAGV